MNSFSDFLKPVLAQEGISAEKFQELLLRLLDFGVLCRHESAIEQQYYDLFVRLEQVVADYFELIGVRLLHDSRFAFVRLVPPGARVPGMMDEQDLPFNGGLRARLSQQDVALVLVLRAEYDKALGEGKIDENGCVRLTLESIAISLKNLLGRQLPETATERRGLLKRMKQLRLLDFASDEALDCPDGWLKIRPMIVSFVSDEVLESLAIEPENMMPEDQKSVTGEVTEVELTLGEAPKSELFADLETPEQLEESEPSEQSTVESVES